MTSWQDPNQPGPESGDPGAPTPGGAVPPPGQGQPPGYDGPPGYDTPPPAYDTGYDAPPGGYASPPPEQPMPAQYPPAGYGYYESSQATTVLVLGILGLVLCGVLAPIAWNMGNKELAAIDAGRRDPSQRGTANAGRILGIIGSVLLIVGLALFVLYIVFIIVLIGSSAAT